MWKQTKVTVGDETADQAMVGFLGKEPEVLEWPTPLDLNAEIKIGDETYFAGDAQACAGKFHMPLCVKPLLPKEEMVEKIETQTSAFSTELAKSEAAIPARKGKKP